MGYIKKIERDFSKYPNRIRELRKARSMTQEELGDLANLSKQQIYKLGLDDLINKDESPLPEDQLELMELYRSIPESQQGAILAMIRSYIKSTDKAND